MINLHKNNSPRAQYKASYLSWIYFIIINMITGWIPRESHRKNIIEGFVSLAVIVSVDADALLMAIYLPILSLIVMLVERHDFVRRWGKTIIETHFWINKTSYIVQI